MVVRTLQCTDPEPRDLLLPHRDELLRIRHVDDLESLLVRLLEDYAPYLTAYGVGASNNERYAIARNRRRRLFSALKRNPTGMSAKAFQEALGLLTDFEERLVVNRPFTRETGRRTQYWPYWSNYLPPLWKLRGQTAEHSPEASLLDHRIRDIQLRKTVWGDRSAVDEHDVETSVGGAFVFHDLDAPGDDERGHRISVRPALGDEHPGYELLSIAAHGLPPSDQAYAGAQVFREGTDLRFDEMGRRQTAGASQAIVPPSLIPHLGRRPVTLGELRSQATFRPFRRPEMARPGIRYDWDHSGDLAPEPLGIDWWGHSHIEAPANAMGIDPRKPVRVYTADRRVPADRALATYSADDVWDAIGALAADTEYGYRHLCDGQPLGPADVAPPISGRHRNDGRGWLQVRLTSGRAVHLSARVTDLDVIDAADPLAEPMSLFQRYLPQPDGTFRENPLWRPTTIESGGPDDRHGYTEIDCTEQRMTVWVRAYEGLDAGPPRPVDVEVEIHPGHDGDIRLGQDVDQAACAGSMMLTDHFYNPVRRTYRSTTHRLTRIDGEMRWRLARESPVQWVEALIAGQDTSYDPSAARHAFLVDQIDLPCTVATAAGSEIWRYAVDHLKVDRVHTVEVEEGGERFTYATYRLTYETVGGPEGQASYIIKRSSDGRGAGAAAIDPLPDFEFQPDEWTFAPLVVDESGRTVIHSHAVSTGYLIDRQGRMNPFLWSSLTRLLYASLSSKTRPQEALLFVDEDGRAWSFDDEPSFRRAVDADLALRAEVRSEVTADSPAHRAEQPPRPRFRH